MTGSSPLRGLAAELGMLSEEKQRAFWAAIEAYDKLGVRYAVAGGLAAGAFGEPRFTSDIDFLVGDEAFEFNGPVVSFIRGLPLRIGDTAVDPVSLPTRHPGRRAILELELDAPYIDVSTGREVAMVSPAGVAYMKLAAMRFKDRHDIISMLNANTVTPRRLEELVEGDAELERALETILNDWRG